VSFSMQTMCSAKVHPMRTFRVDLRYRIDFVLFAASPAPLTRGSALASSSRVAATATAAPGHLICRCMMLRSAQTTIFRVPWRPAYRKVTSISQVRVTHCQRRRHTAARLRDHKGIQRAATHCAIGYSVLNYV
jgi:hypothetical protein